MSLGKTYHISEDKVKAKDIGIPSSRMGVVHVLFLGGMQWFHHIDTSNFDTDLVLFSVPNLSPSNLQGDNMDPTSWRWHEANLHGYNVHPTSWRWNEVKKRVKWND
jgi:hypothetical protein